MKALPVRMLRHLLQNVAVLTLAIGAALTPAPQAAAQGTGYWHTSGGQIVDGCGNPTRINGISWYGFETNNYVINDLWGSETYTEIMQQIQADGFNTIRIPFSNDMVEHNPVITNNLEADPELQGLTSLQILDKIVAEAGALGLKVILDDHRSEAQDPNGPFGYTGNEPNGLWYTNGYQGYLTTYTEQNWIQDWQTMVTRYAGPNTTFVDANGNPTVIGVDIRNEPHLQQTLAASYTATSTTTAWGGSCWTGDTTSQSGDNSPCPTSNLTNNWPAAAARAGNAVLAINPNLLIFVQGVDVYDNDYRWAGGNLEGAGNNQVTLSVPNQLVYSAHDYGPEEYAQPWLNVSNTGTAANPVSSSLFQFWDTEWGNLTTGSNPVPVWLGEFGTQNATPADYACYPAGTTCTTPYPADASPDLQVLDATTGSQGLWFNSLINYLKSDPVGQNINWSYWALNEEDSDALLNSAMTGVALPAKETALQSIQNDPQFSGDACPAPTDFATIQADATNSSLTFTWNAPTPAADAALVTSYALINSDLPSSETAGSILAYSLVANPPPPATMYPDTGSAYLDLNGVIQNQYFNAFYAPAVAGQTTYTIGGPPWPIGPNPTGYTTDWVLAAVGPGGVLSATTPVATGTTLSAYGCITPVPPANLTATVVSSSQINLSWTADPLAQLGLENPPCSLVYFTESVPVGAQYSGEFDEPGAQYAASILGSTTGTSYSVTDLDASTQYCYTLQAGLQNTSQAEGPPYFDESFQPTAICATTSAPTPAVTNVTYSVVSSTSSTSGPASGAYAVDAVYSPRRSSYIVSDFQDASSQDGHDPSTIDLVETTKTLGNQRFRNFLRAGNTLYKQVALTSSAATASSTTSQFQAAIAIANNATTPINGWTLQFTFPGGQTITDFWDGNATQTGSAVTVTNESYNATIPAQGSVTGIGFTANGVAATPTFITVNGQPASINGVRPAVATLVPAPAPVALTATATGGTTIQLNWSAVAPTPATPSITYQVYRSTTAGFTPGIGNLIASGVTTPSYTDSGLTVSTTYYYVIAAADAVGSNGYSPQASATTQAQSNYCHIAYAVTTSWPSGGATDFQSSVTINNIGKTALSSWTIGWQFPNTTTSITPGDVWNGNLLTNSGGNESISNVSYNGSIPAGGSYTLSFQGSYTGTNTNPTAFTVNGVSCQ